MYTFSPGKRAFVTRVICDGGGASQTTDDDDDDDNDDACGDGVPAIAAALYDGRSAVNGT